MTVRQVRVYCDGTEALDLNASPYALVAGSWNSTGQYVECQVLIQSSTLADVERAADGLRQWVRRATAWQTMRVGQAVELWTKTCDDLATTAELGATWRKRRVRGGTVTETDTSESAPGLYASTLQMMLEMDGAWQRATPASVGEASAATVAVDADGDITTPSGTWLRARRVTFDSDTGLTVRCHMVYETAYPSLLHYIMIQNSGWVYAYWSSNNRKFMMRDAEGNAATTQAQTFSDGQVVEVVFRWSPTLGMAIWVDGTLAASNNTCVWNNQQVGADVLTNGSFNTYTGTLDDGTSDTWTGWTAVNDDGTGNKTEATATAQSGQAVKLTRTTGSAYVTQAYTGVAAGEYWELKFHTRGNGTSGGNYRVMGYDGTTFVEDLVPASTPTGVTGTTYMQIRKVLHIPAGVNKLLLVLSKTDAGVAYFDTVTLKKLGDEEETYRLLWAAGGQARVRNVQVWPTGLTNAECAGLAAWGRPENEVCVATPPTDDKWPNAKYLLQNVAGSAPAALRAIMDYGDAPLNDDLWVGLRPLSATPTTLFEAESGTLGASVSVVASTYASNAQVARWSSAAPTTSWVSRVTFTLCADPADLAAMRGRHSVILVAYGGFGKTEVCAFRFLVQVAGAQYIGEYSAEVEVDNWSGWRTVNLGDFELPPGAWPDESIRATTDINTGSFVTLTIDTKVATTMAGNFDFDAIILLPAEVSGTATLPTLVFSTSHLLVLDWASESPAWITAHDERSLEFENWAEYSGSELLVEPARGPSAGTLVVVPVNAWPSYTLDCRLFVANRWV